MRTAPFGIAILAAGGVLSLALDAGGANPVPTSCGGFTQSQIRATNYADVAPTWFDVALPWPRFKKDFRNGVKHWVSIRRRNTTLVRRVPIKEVGPWNEYDNYWEPTPSPPAAPTPELLT